ncbi:Hypothetical_protein [Hexamita inflata]|uniref:Hypothetical_protein n=1 Tax=Hexamita inflata TaxID=28002 RepID=A0AA86PK18_9EUKA|nr:Hypothetical protein HINF_LOCUS27372 [Hexamita inflata]
MYYLLLRRVTKYINKQDTKHKNYTLTWATCFQRCKQRQAGLLVLLTLIYNETHSVLSLNRSSLTPRSSRRWPSYTENVSTRQQCKHQLVYILSELSDANVIRSIQCKFHEKLIRQPARRYNLTHDGCETKILDELGYNCRCCLRRDCKFRPAAFIGNAENGLIHTQLEEAAAFCWVCFCLELVESGVLWSEKLSSITLVEPCVSTLKSWKQILNPDENTKLSDVVESHQIYYNVTIKQNGRFQHPAVNTHTDFSVP